MEGHETVNEQGNFMSLCWVEIAATGPGLASGHSHLEDLINWGLYGQRTAAILPGKLYQKKKKLLVKVDIKRKTPLNLFKNYLYLALGEGLPGGLALKNLPAVQETWV